MNPYDPDGRDWWNARLPAGHTDLPYTIDLAEQEKVGANGFAGMTIMSDGAPSRMFMRRALRQAMSSRVQCSTWLVGELDGVRAYMVKSPEGRVGVVLTKRDLYP